MKRDGVCGEEPFPGGRATDPSEDLARLKLQLDREQLLRSRTESRLNLLLSLESAIDPAAGFLANLHAFLKCVAVDIGADLAFGWERKAGETSAQIIARHRAATYDGRVVADQQLLDRLVALHEPGKPYMIVSPDLAATDLSVSVRDKLHSWDLAALLSIQFAGGENGTDIDIGMVFMFRDPAADLVSCGNRLVDLSRKIRTLLAQRQSADHQAQLAADQLRMALEGTSDSIVMMDRNWRVTYLNRHAEALIADGRNLLHMHYWEAFPDAVGGPFWQGYQRAMNERVAVTINDFYPPHQAWYEVNAYPSEQGIVIYFRDVTRRVEAEAALRENDLNMRRLIRERSATIDALPAHIALLDEAGTVIYVNRIWRETAAQSGIPGAAAGIGSNYIALCDEAISAGDIAPRHITEGIRSALSGRSGAVPFDYRSSLETDSWFRFLVEPIDGDHRGVVVMHVDITAFKLTQMELQRSRERAELASRTKTEFLANMSHELRTPLNAIIGFSEALREGYFGGLSAQQAEYIRDIHDSGRHLLHVVNDILDLSKVEAGRLELSREAVEPKALIDSCLSLMRGRAHDAGLTLTLETRSSPELFHVDKTRVRQIVLNLLSNAIKFTPKGGRVAVRLAENSASDVVVTIIDTGIGMRADEIGIALQPFRQIDNSLARRYEGTGLGLPLARLLTELHGGQLHIDSAPGIGTAVTVTLPR